MNEFSLLGDRVAHVRPRSRSGVGTLFFAACVLAFPSVVQAWTGDAFVSSRERNDRYSHRAWRSQSLTDRIPFGVFVRDAGYGRRRAAMDLLGPAKIDIVTTGWGNSKQAQDQLDDIARRCRDANTLLFYDMNSESREGRINDFNFNRKGFADSPGLGGWMHTDDANVTSLHSRSDVQRLERLIRNYNPYASDREAGNADIRAATMITTSESGGSSPYEADRWTSIADICALQTYPIRRGGGLGKRKAYKVFKPLENLRFSADANGCVPMAILQLSGNPAQTESNDIIQPNSGEMSVMSHLALAAGVRGILWYGFESNIEERLDRKNQNLWNRLKELRIETTQMEGHLLASAPTTKQIPGYNFFRAVWPLNYSGHRGDRLVVLINADQVNHWHVRKGGSVNIGQTNASPRLRDGISYSGRGKGEFQVRRNDRGDGLIYAPKDLVLKPLQYRVMYVDVWPYLGSKEPWQ